MCNTFVIGLCLLEPEPPHNSLKVRNTVLHRYDVGETWWSSVISELLVVLGSSVCMATRYGLDGPWIESRWGEVYRASPDWVWNPRSLL
jgi:hypothetical protein